MIWKNLFFGSDCQPWSLGFFECTIPEADLEEVQWSSCDLEVGQGAVLGVYVIKYDPVLGEDLRAVQVLVNGLNRTGKGGVRARRGEEYCNFA